MLLNLSGAVGVDRHFAGAKPLGHGKSAELGKTRVRLQAGRGRIDSARFTLWKKDVPCGKVHPPWQRSSPSSPPQTPDRAARRSGSTDVGPQILAAYKQMLLALFVATLVISGLVIRDHAVVLLCASGGRGAQRRQKRPAADGRPGVCRRARAFFSA